MGDYQEYVYWAEVYFAMSEFIQSMAVTEDMNREGESVSISSEGFSQSVSGVSGKKKVAMKYYMKACGYLRMAGYDVFKLERC